jgi:Holliday junction resolvase-like predicted endonuclease
LIPGSPARPARYRGAPAQDADFRRSEGARHTLDDAAQSVSERRRARIAACAEAWLPSNTQPDGLDMRLGAMLVAPGTMPRHISAAFGN